MKLSVIITAFLLALGGTNLSARAVVISDTTVSFGGSGSLYGATVIQHPNGNYTCINFTYAGTTLAASDWCIDEESDWYLASYGQSFSAGTIAAGQFTPIFTTDNARPPVPIPLGRFYLGINTGVLVWTPSGTDRSQMRSAFGWLELENTGTQLIPRGNAFAYNEGGIIIGTTSIPEPASALLLLPIATLLCRRRSHAL